MRTVTHRTRLSLPSAALAGRRRAAFTLVEVLLALALTMLVLAAAYSGLTLFQRVTVAGRKDAERSQLARAIERRIAADIRCVLFRETPPGGDGEGEGGEGEGGEGEGGEGEGGEGEGGEGEGEGGGATDNDSADNFNGMGSTAPPEPAVPLTPSEAFASEEVGLFGDATMLVLHVAKPPRESSASPAASTSLAAPVAIRSDLHSICYLLATPGAEGMQGAVSDAAAGGLAHTIIDRRGHGLARLDADRMTMGQTDAEQAAADVAILPGQAAIIAEEVTELGFRYFDGASWLTEWNSVELNALPRAVEVTVRVDVDRDEEPTNAFLAAPPPSASDVYRFVVALPQSDPTLGLEL